MAGTNATYNGANAQIWNCDEATESWYLGDDSKLHAGWDPSVCLDVAGTNATHNGANAQIWNCSEVTETWYLGDDSKLHAGWDPSVCLEVGGTNATYNGANVQIWNCDEVTESFLIEGGAPPVWLASLAGKRARVSQLRYRQ